MSEVKAITKAALTKVYRPFVDGIVSATEALANAEHAVTLSRVAVGRIIGQAVSAMTSAGASATEAQERIMDTVGTVTADVEWSTVQGWIRAAVVEDSLPTELRDTFTTEALVTIGRLPEGEARETLASVAVESGATGVRALREGVKAAQADAGTGKVSKGTAARTAEVVKHGRKLHDAIEGDLTTESAVLFGIAIGRKFHNYSPAVLRAAVEEILYDGPTADDDGIDS